MTAPLRVRHRPWPRPAQRAPMPAPGEGAGGLVVTDRALLRGGVPFIPVSGELHFSRVPRARWRERVRQLRAQGITVVASYVFWLHHVAERGIPRFDGGLDIGAFIDECADAGLDVALRIGPWAHGEARNGGFPDWVQAAPVAHRTDDPAYLALVEEWFGQLAAALDGRVRPGGPVLAIQLENELYDRPEHLVTLKRLARAAGMSAPLWTATAWGGADLPEGEVFPLYGGYSDGFWQDPAERWHPSFRQHFLFSHAWDDPGVGADVRATQGFGATTTADAPASGSDAPSSAFPPATCELGGGMATAYHRRPVPSALDIAALAHTKIGNGSAWQGYYMFAGGANPRADLEESHATGYPNDLTRRSYDFHAPIGQAGDARESAALLRGQHAFLAAFGDRLGGTTSSLPDLLPDGSGDSATLRWALRSDGDGGFLFVSRHQPHMSPGTYSGARFEVDGAVLPSRPVDIPPGTLARWPVGLEVGGVRVRWATASAVTMLAGPTLVLAADAGIPVEIAVDDDVIAVEPSLEPVLLAGADVLVLPVGARPWVRDGTLLLSDGELAWDAAELHVRGGDDVHAYDPATRSWRTLEVPAREAAPVGSAGAVERRSARAVPADYGFAGPRHSAPGGGVFDELATVLSLELPDWAYDPEHDAVIEIEWAGDVGELRVDGTTVDDRFWDGSTWRISVQDAGLHPGSDPTLHLLPLSPESTVRLPAAAADRLRSTPGGDLLAIDAVRVVSRGPWRRVSL